MPDYVWENLVLEAKKLKIEIIFDVFGAQSLKLVDELGCKSVMIHATDLNNINLLENLAKSSLYT